MNGEALREIERSPNSELDPLWKEIFRVKLFQLGRCWLPPKASSRFGEFRRYNQVQGSRLGRRGWGGGGCDYCLQVFLGGLGKQEVKWIPRCSLLQAVYSAIEDQVSLRSSPGEVENKESGGQG